MKVKNIMFFGFAAAILSAAGAQAAATATFSPAVSAPDAAGRQIVSSKSYVDSVATNIAGQLKSVAVTGDYNDLDNKPTVDTTFNSSSTNAATSAAIATYVGDQITAAAPTIDSALSTTSENAVQNKVVTTELNKKANSDDLATVATSGAYSDLTGTPTVDSTYNSTSGNAQAGTAVAEAISDALNDVATDLSGKQDNLGGTGQGGKVVTATETAGTVTYTTLADVATSGSYNDLTDTPTVDSTFDSGSSNAATSAAIATYINNQNFTTVDSVIPAKPAFCTDANPCALLQDANGYNWYSMATDQSTTRQAGTDEKPNPRS